MRSRRKQPTSRSKIDETERQETAAAEWSMDPSME